MELPSPSICTSSSVLMRRPVEGVGLLRSISRQFRSSPCIQLHCVCRLCPRRRHQHHICASLEHGNMGATRTPHRSRASPCSLISCHCAAHTDRHIGKKKRQAVAVEARPRTLLSFSAGLLCWLLARCLHQSCVARKRGNTGALEGVIEGGRAGDQTRSRTRSGPWLWNRSRL